jgi:hypothetical protein
VAPNPSPGGSDARASQDVGAPRGGGDDPSLTAAKPDQPRGAETPPASAPQNKDSAGLGAAGAAPRSPNASPGAAPPAPGPGAASVDTPGSSASRAAVAPPPGAAEAPPPRPPAASGGDYAASAQDLTVAYLQYWSAPADVALEAASRLYAPQILFYGRRTSARAVFEEKRRFVRRWPVRDYRPITGTMRTTCDGSPPICRVRTAIEFTASNPRRRRRSQGTALLELHVSFAGGDPVIVAETSGVATRGRIPRGETLDDDDDDSGR